MSKKINNLVRWIDENKTLSVIIAIIGLISGIFGIINYYNQPKFEGRLRTFYGDTIIIFGSNTFSGCPNILVVNDVPIFTSTIKNGRLFISILIFDREGKIVAKIEENKWKVNQNNFFDMEISNTEIKITNQYNEVAVHCIANLDGSVRLNGIFYVEGLQVVATDEGMTFSSIS